MTTFVGPNGAGKSTVLRALEWFFVAPKGVLTDHDLHQGANPGSPIRVRVDFSDLSAHDREVIGPKYCPEDVSTCTVWRTWQEGVDKITGKAFALSEFEAVRAQATATDKRNIYNQLRESRPDLSLPKVTTVAHIDAAIDAWERAHPEELSTAEVSDTHLHGFNGQGVLAQLIDFVFVSADLRATIEAEDAKASIFGRILQRAVDRTALEEGVRNLNDQFRKNFAALTGKHLDPQLKVIADELSREVGTFVTGRAVALQVAEPEVRQPASRVDVQVSDGTISTPIGYQGHGFQRTLLVAALRVLARHGRQPSEQSHMFLAIEEPELFQHPTQAKALASVLRSIACNDQQSVQVAYATHSPYFVEPQSFTQIRRLTSSRETGSACAASSITTASFDKIVDDLNGYVKLQSIQRRWEQVCLKHLPEALFAESVILVEGDEDAAILEAVGQNVNTLAIGGICVAPVQGKTNMLIPFAILKRLGVRTLMVADNDSGKAGRMRQDRKTEEEIARAVEATRRENRELCRFVGAIERDFPTDAVSDELFFMPDTLESVLETDLPQWRETRRLLIKEGRGVDGKNAATYALAARECGNQPGPSISEIFSLLSRAA